MGEPSLAQSNISSKRSPNHASNTSSSALVIGTGSGQSSVTVHADRSCFGGPGDMGDGLYLRHG